MIKFDTETCGYHSIAVLLQYQIDNYPIELYELFHNKIGQTRDLIAAFANHPGGVLGFNLAFDWFHLCKWHTIIERLIEVYGEQVKDWYPVEHIPEMALVEKDARDGPCLKPVTACDLFLHAKKGKYQSCMDRHDIRIRKVPEKLAYKLAEELHKRIPLNPLYFARRKTHHENPWQVFDIVDKEDENKLVKGFKDIVLKFAPSSALKAIAQDALGIDKANILRFEDVELPPSLHPTEYGWAPFAAAVEDISKGNFERSWPAWVKYHIDHWHYNSQAREYATKDVVYLDRLYPYFDNPIFGDIDSVLACAVAAVRWRGYSVDTEKMSQLLEETKTKETLAPTAPSYVKKWIHPDLSPLEIISTKGSTKKVVLKEMTKWLKDCDCDKKGVFDNTCKKCKGKGTYRHPAAIKAASVLEARSATKEREILEKILQAGRFHASVKVIGALSGRMSGADGLNPQGIKATKKVRSCFTLSHPDMCLIGGDFEAFEVNIALAIYNDPQLEKDLEELGLCPDCLGHKFELCSKCKYHGRDKCLDCGKTGLSSKICQPCKGTGKVKKKIHAIFGETAYDLSYDEIVATKGEEEDLYTNSKRGVFAKMYGGNANTLVDRLGIDIINAEKADMRWCKRYPGIGKSQQRILDSFGSMRQPNGIGSKVEWHEPADSIPSLLGFHRYFTLENRICKELFTLAENPPKDWLNTKIMVRRRDRDQTATGAVRSALFGAAFQIQAANVRAATNHEIQATGAGITKSTQKGIWDLQPSGSHSWVVMPLNIHDEIMCPTKKGRQVDVETVVQNKIEEFKTIVPKLSIDWSNELKTWADK